MPYSFDTILLSAAKTGSPQLIGTIITANGVTMTSLSTYDKGLVFNKQTNLISDYVTGILTGFASPSLSAATLSTLGLTATSDWVAPISATNVTVQGSIFKIDTAYNTAVMALVKIPINNVATYTVFTHLSALTTVPLSAITAGVVEVSDPELRRKWVLGYV